MKDPPETSKKDDSMSFLNSTPYKVSESIVSEPAAAVIQYLITQLNTLKNEYIECKKELNHLKKRQNDLEWSVGLENSNLKDALEQANQCVAWESEDNLSVEDYRHYHQ
jgi:hypothetical protein